MGFCIAMISCATSSMVVESKANLFQVLCEVEFCTVTFYPTLTYQRSPGLGYKVT